MTDKEEERLHKICMYAVWIIAIGSIVAFLASCGTGYQPPGEDIWRSI
jgi:hypothetical protein